MDTSEWDDFEQYSGYTMASLETNATTGMRYIEGYSSGVDPADVYVRHKLSYPTNYWAYAIFRHEYTLTPGKFFDVNKATIGGSSASHPAGADWSWTFVEIKREGGYYFKLYYDGVFQKYILNSSTIPSYWGIQGDGGQYDLRGFYIDHVIIGTNENHHSVDTMPSTWFIAKDMVDPGFTGFYSAPNTQVSPNYFYASYG